MHLGNVILDESRGDRIEIIGFGRARVDELVSLTMHTRVLGALETMAPEVVLGKAADAQADLYSLGVTIFELLSGSLPYRAATAAGVIQMHREAPVADIRVFVRAVPERIAETLLRAMARAPEDRFESAAEMREAFFGTGKALVHWAVSHDWEQYKVFYRERRPVATEKRWQVYLPARFEPYNQAQIEALVGLFQTYRDFYRGPLVDGLPAFLSQKSRSKGGYKAVLLASGMACYYAEKMRQTLGRAGIHAEVICLDEDVYPARKVARWKWLRRLQNIPRHWSVPLLVLLAIASYFAVMEARAIGEPAVSAAVLPGLAGSFWMGWLCVGALWCGTGQRMGSQPSVAPGEVFVSVWIAGL